MCTEKFFMSHSYDLAYKHVYCIYIIIMLDFLFCLHIKRKYIETLTWLVFHVMMVGKT